MLLDNTKAARKFLQLCDEQSLPLVIETEANNYLHARLQGDAKTAKDEMAFYTKSVKTTIKGGVAACLAKNKLERLIKGCPPNARHKLRKLLADDVVSQARDQSPSLTSAILALQNAPPEWSEADLELTSLVLNIRTVLSDIEVDKQLSFVKNEKVVELFRAIEEGLSKKTLDLSALLVKLCPGANTTTGAAIFVGALVGHLISKAEGPFDFEGVLSAVRLSGMPGAYTKHIAYPALMAMTGEDATRLAQAMSNLLGETGITLAELMALKQLATELEFYAVEHELPSKSWTLIIHQSTDAIRKFTETRAGMQDSEEQARHDAEVRERELKAKQRMRENEAKLKEERKNNILASLPDGVTGTMALFSEHGNIAEKVSRVRALLDQLDEKHLDVHKIACDLAELGSTDALGLLGSLAAALPPEDGRALLLAVPRELRERLNYEATVRAIASNWWHIKAGPEGRRDLVGIVKEFCDFIKPLKALVGFDAWSCGRHMRSITIGNMQPHELEYTQDHETVERMLGKL
ncbi:hypothetical protein GCM10023165_41080 [Variovorax defluvii]|uniref:Uncharacterized protein n=1 Tax=Variovorax defluvii TaxID=913761 RepID=A0ABP8I628_9BURK